MRKSDEDKLEALAAAGKGDGRRADRLRERVAAAAATAVERDDPYIPLPQDERVDFWADNESEKTETRLVGGQEGPWGTTEEVPSSPEPKTFTGTGGWEWVDNGDGSFTVADGQQGAGTKYAAGSNVAKQVAREREFGADQAPAEPAAPAGTAADLIEAAAPAAPPTAAPAPAESAAPVETPSSSTQTGTHPYASALIEATVDTPEASSWWDAVGDFMNTDIRGVDHRVGGPPAKVSS
tara:strand:- start:2676 stop:3389 length:714 start_codon:yes stop_codon:yes gene_type:complete